MAKKKTEDTHHKKHHKSRALAVRGSAPLYAAPRKHHRRRHHSFGATDNKALMGALGAAVLLGVLEAKGVSIPKIGAVGEAGTLALAGYALEQLHVTNSVWVRSGVIGLGSIAAYEAAKKAAGATVHGHYQVR